ncbi:MAG: PHP domain-containing protein [Candidatus Omnitrophota bacterium]
MSPEVKYADLHLHTMFSDGTYSPEELISGSRKAGLSAVSVVDHDTVDGVGPSMEIAKTQGIEVLSGIELSAEYEGLEIHILGYLIDQENKDLLAKLEVLRENRIARVYKIVGKLKDMGVDLNPQAVFDISGPGTAGRLHIARALVLEGKVKSVFEAFQKYIGDRCPAYVLGFKFSPSEAIKVIKDAGGIPVLAHPYLIKDDDVISKFIDCGLMGLEAYYPEHTQSMVNFYLNLARKHDLLVTGGSDCHGKAKPEVKIGSVKIPYELVERLKSAKNKREGV